MIEIMIQYLMNRSKATEGSRQLNKPLYIATGQNSTEIRSTLAAQYMLYTAHLHIVSSPEIVLLAAHLFVKRR